ncbi:hypothetical protein P9281_02590 [Caballeronia sp. LP003]|uniref:hypothetical protein n=1 Tax=Caballeronia sp. LP003 TaxID=3038551 RepID=UPI002865B201|nr:hypothetical protein [Caballeronia sp. LP003]MDR5785440.1 hypothetical protein [Caballeronia sp. LP003]
MKRSQNGGSQRGSLPALFYQNNGNIDVELIADIWNRSVSSIRKMKPLIGPEKFSYGSDSDRFRALASLAEDRAMRKRWYDDYESRKKDIVASFPLLAQRYVKQIVPELDLHGEEMSRVFKKATDGKLYPDLTLVGDLATTLLKHFSSHPRATALFGWALMEHAQMSTARALATKGAALRQFPEVLMQTLEEREAEALITLIGPPPREPWTGVAESNEKSQPVLEFPEPSSVLLNKPGITQPAQTTRDPAIESVRVRMTACYNSAASELDARQRSLAALCAELSESRDPLQVVDRIKVKIAETERAVEKAACERDSIAFELLTRLENLPGLGDVPKSWLQLPLIFGMRGETNEIDSFCEDIQRLVDAKLRFSSLSAETVEHFRPRIDESMQADRGHGLLTLLQLARDAETYSADQQVCAAALKYIGAVAENTDWLATDDPGMEAYWPTLAKTVLRAKPLDPISWLMCRHVFSPVFDEIVAVAKTELEPRCYIDIVGVCRCLAALSPYQLEQLSEAVPGLETAIALTQAFGFLVALKLRDERKFDYWSLKPLRRFTKDASDSDLPLLDRLLATIFSEGSAGDADDTVSEIIEISREHMTEAGNAPQNDTETWGVLDQVLSFRSHGFGHYAALWRIAYRDCIEPLQKIRKSETLVNCAKLLLDAIEIIDVDAAYPRWVRATDAAILSESQYEAATKVYVSGRLEKIRDWCISTLEAAANSVPSRRSIRAVLAVSQISPDRDRLITWLKRSGADLAERQLSVPVLRSDEQDTVFGVGFTPSVQMPRSYLAWLAGKPLRWKGVVTDALAGLAGATGPSALWTFYRAKNSLEAQERLRDECNEALPEMDTRALDQEIQFESLKLAIRISDLHSKLLSMDATGSASAIERQARLYYEEKRWTLCRGKISELTDVVQALEDRHAESEKRANLERDIAALNGASHASQSIAVLEETLADLMRSSSERRHHIVVLEEFLSTRNLKQHLVEVTREAVRHLSVPQRLPDPDSSAFLAEAWSAFLSPISEQLKRPHVLVPGYRELLELLAGKVIRFMAHEPSAGNIDSPFTNACIDCAQLLDSAASPSDLETLIDRFAEAAEMRDLAELLETQGVSGPDNQPSADEKASASSVVECDSETQQAGTANAIAATLEWIKRYSVETEAVSQDFRHVLESGDWSSGIGSCLRVLEGAQSVTVSGHSRQRDALLTAIVCTAQMPNALSDSEASTALGLLGLCEDSSAVQWLLSEKGRLGGSIAADLYGAVLIHWAAGDIANFAKSRSDARNAVTLAIRALGDMSGLKVPRQEAIALFGVAPAAGFPGGLAIKSIWDAFTGDKGQAEVRASFMQMLFKAGLYRHVGLCFTFSPIEMETRVALAYAQLLQNSDSVRGREALENIRSASQAKPFVAFAQAVLATLSRSQGLPAEISFAAPLEKTASHRTWLGVLTIQPRAINPPLDIEIELPVDCGMKFANGRRKVRFEGPFLESRDERVELFIDVPEIHSTVISARCIFHTLEESDVVADVELNIHVAGLDPFKSVSDEQIESAFNYFPQFQMRGDQYVVRDEDERKIETILFGRERAGSLWLSSPRRSGKTTMLFRILDGFSHVMGRDNAIIFLSLDKGFHSVEEFNRWVWLRVQSNEENGDLRELIDDFSRIGERLPFAAGADVFLTALSKEILNKIPKLTRVYFLFDEIDKLAEMTFSRGKGKEVATELTWQFRHILSSQPAIGIVFCGSNPARQLFVRDPAAALYNSITNFELTPFGTETDLEKHRSREVVEPGVLRGRYRFPDKTLTFLTRITAGIPYYMKLVAGATYGVAKQAYLMPSDVTNGLKALLEKSTGVTALDSLDDPGEDELRVLVARQDEDQLLIRSVLYAAAEIKSPVSSGHLMVRELSSDRSPLVSRYKLSRADINLGLESALQLGYLRRLRDIAAVEFAIPMLGESIRARSGALWAIINDKLEQRSSQ